ncbi:MAG: NifU family protein [Candidatus Nitrohelix vancouverensis]|uniref:NifU family protein n=1 Tax=Candidatus Nitrohelix vancouverensis TaxID=2705534 RepID=A0A7T0C001_9BACT|nr:MAG: NifU family protein [Candidatus Nitrohelix vancouverensis]
MKILEVQETPNPAARKFVMDGPVTDKKTESIAIEEDEEYNGDNPLAREIFKFGATELFFCGNDVSVTMFNETAWKYFMNDVLHAIETQLSPENKARIEQEKKESVVNRIDKETFPSLPDEDKRIIVEELMDEMIRPALANDGGGLEILNVEGNDIHIKYQGACGSCPSSTGGTLRAIEKTVRGYLNPDMAIVIKH